MKNELQKELYLRHETLLKRSRYKEYKRCAIIERGLEVDDGWFNIINDMLRDIEKLCQNYNKMPLILQIKEKFGLLRVYFKYTDLEELDNKLDEIIESYVNRSKTTCECCGSPGNVQDVHGRLKSVCHKCKVKLICIKTIDDDY